MSVGFDKLSQRTLRASTLPELVEGSLTPHPQAAAALPDRR